MSQPTLRTERLLPLVGPIFLQQATQSVVMLADFWFFSRLSDAVAATVGQLLPIVWIGTFVIPVFAGTGVSVASQFMGAGRLEKVVPTYLMNLALTTAMGAALAAVVFFFAPAICGWMGLHASLHAIGAAYLGTISVYFVFLGVLVAYNAVLSSRGMTHWLMYQAFLIATLNVVLAAWFLFGFGWGLRGVVAASVVSVAVGTVVAVWLVHARLGVRFHRRGAWRDMRGVLRPMLRIGLANALEPFSYSVQQIILSTMIIALGVDAMAANTYAARPQMMQITFSVSLALGAQILMAHWMGAQRIADVNRLFWRALRRGMLVAFGYALTLWLASDFVLGLFTHDPAVHALGRKLLLIAVCYEPARAVNIIGGFALKTVGDARFPMVLGVVFIWGILPVVFAIDRVWHLTVAGFWMCFAADEIIRAGINLWRWRTGRWQHMGIVAEAPAAPGEA
ncbi:MAG TPA: MATE family efflux transporter [Opitutus sp.]|nr:MATE family efflux transporter [Opitutus sp.]